MIVLGPELWILRLPHLKTEPSWAKDLCHCNSNKKRVHDRTYRLQWFLVWADLYYGHPSHVYSRMPADLAMFPSTKLNVKNFDCFKFRCPYFGMILSCRVKCSPFWRIWLLHASCYRYPAFFVHFASLLYLGKEGLSLCDETTNLTLLWKWREQTLRFTYPTMSKVRGNVSTGYVATLRSSWGLKGIGRSCLFV